MTNYMNKEQHNHAAAILREAGFTAGKITGTSPTRYLVEVITWKEVGFESTFIHSLQEARDYIANHKA